MFLLYHQLTGIKWDFNSPMIKGVMTRSKFNDIIDFEIDPADKSDYDVSNMLWDLMEGEESTVLVPCLDCSTNNPSTPTTALLLCSLPEDPS